MLDRTHEQLTKNSTKGKRNLLTEVLPSWKMQIKAVYIDIVGDSDHVLTGYLEAAISPKEPWVQVI